MKPHHPVSSYLLNLAALAALVMVLSAAFVTTAFAQDDRRISVEVAGQGPDVILVPGYASSREVWRGTAEHLSGRYRVHLVQLSGFAGQPWRHGDGPLLDPAVEAIADYARSLESPAYIGHSMGGLIGLHLVQNHPDLLSGVMSVDSLPFYGSLFGPTMTADMVRPMVQQMTQAIRTVPDEAFRQQQEQTAVGMTLTEAKRAVIVEDSMRSDRQALATAIGEIAVSDRRAGMEQVTTPFWAVYAVDNSGPQGQMAKALWEREYASLNGVRLEPIEGSRHFIMYDQPERLNALIDRFLTVVR